MGENTSPPSYPAHRHCIGRGQRAKPDGPSSRSMRMKDLIAFDLDGTLAESKQPLGEAMGDALARLLPVAHVAVISGGAWPQFAKPVASRLPERPDRPRPWLMPTARTKPNTPRAGQGPPV